MVKIKNLSDSESEKEAQKIGSSDESEGSCESGQENENGDYFFDDDADSDELSMEDSDGDSMEEEMRKVTTFWGTHLKPSDKPFVVESTDQIQQRCAIHLRLATFVWDDKLGDESPKAMVQANVGGKAFVLCHLSERCPQHKMNLFFNPDDKVSLSVVGNVTAVLTGEYSAWLSADEIQTILDDSD
eukprot:NODE_4388_length_796_cov_344.106129_g4230_i0.p1 GENE.NODE_4388_length_796_cov_344.106129_g4230_i0~~NODE_4388_length_796_cov_344.106129_g4230_i0.p1  ORF type:complete len:186 (+),score=37.46 NODE_4388_length_796_cov_344.106129_g4230_i0:88-645(+)